MHTPDRQITPDFGPDSEKCEACNGTGKEYFADEESGMPFADTCEVCGGSGEIEEAQPRKYKQTW